MVFSLLLCAAVLAVGFGSYGVINGHLQVYTFGQPMPEWMGWFFFHPLHPLPLSPSELMMYACAVLPAVWIARRGVALMRGKRPPSGHSPKCAYDLRATPDRCPECGTAAAAPTGGSA